MNHRQRIETCISGGKPDRVPVALWRHFQVDDQYPDELAAAVLAYQRTYDFDIVKVTPESAYSVRAWGVESEWTGNPEGTRNYTRLPIKEPEDWTRLTPLDPHSGVMGDTLTSLRTIVAELGPNVPVIQTIFSPLGQAKKMAGDKTLLTHMRRNPDALHEGLKTIAQTSLRYMDALRDIGLAGVFYAVQQGQYGVLSAPEFAEFGRAYDLQVLEPAKDYWLNLLHIHGNNIMFDQVADYPVHILNWHDRETPPTLAEAKEKFAGAVCGGLRQWQTLLYGTPEQVRAEAQDAIEATDGHRFILGTGCVAPISAPHGNLMAARRVVEA